MLFSQLKLPMLTKDEVIRMVTVAALTCGVCATAICYLWSRSKWRRGRSKRLVIFSRYPAPGMTKTRLIPELGERGAACLQLYMTEHILDRVEKSHEVCDFHTEVFCNGGNDKQLSYWLGKKKKAWLSWRPQSGGGLGDKIKHAFNSLFTEGAEFVVMIGSDIPGISCEIIDEAFQLLRQGRQMVLGKAEDGGYYLVGLSRDVTSRLDQIFEGIDWGTEQVYCQQTARARELGVRLGVLRAVLSDVDTISDISVFERETGLSRSQLTEPHLSVIIPVFNEEQNIEKTLKSVIEQAKFKERLDIIVTDGGSSDNTVDEVIKFGRNNPVSIQVVNCRPGRGWQLQFGAKFAKGDNLLFLHADSVLPNNFDETLQHCLEIPGNVGGAFKFDLDILHPDLWSEKISTLFFFEMKLLVKFTQRRASKFELPYGDQGLFMRRSTYNKVGGFDPLYLMEDYIMVQKLKKLGHVSIAPGEPIITSARRWQRYGYVRVTGLNCLLIKAYNLGVHPNTLARIYYGREKLEQIESAHLGTFKEE